MKIDRLVCPKCPDKNTSFLEMKVSDLVCNQCHSIFPVHSGIPCFVAGSTAVENQERINKERAIRDQEAGIYNDVIADFNRRLEKTRMREAANFNELDTWLDAGCGIGDVVEKMHTGISDITACDYSLGSLLQLQTRLKMWNRLDIDLVEADLTRLPFKDESFSKVTSGQVLQHLPGRRMFLQSLREILRVMKPGGRAVLTLFQFHGLQKWIYEKIYKTDFQKEGQWSNQLQFYRYSRSELAASLSQLGCDFEITTIKHLPDRLGEKLGSAAVVIDKIMGKTGFLSPLGSYFLVSIHKQKS